MDDLISRRVANEAIEEEWNGCCSEYPASQIINETQQAIDRIDAVPAVPLDKLCRMLAKYIGFPCNYSPIDEEMADYCGDQCEMDDIGCWQKVLTKWMEGLDE